MKARRLATICLLLLACDRQPEKPEPQRQPLPPAAPPQMELATVNQAVAGESRAPVKARVVQVVQDESYSFLEVEDGAGRTWVAAPRLSVRAGEEVLISSYVPRAAAELGLSTQGPPRVLLALQIRGETVRLSPIVPALAGSGSELPPGHPPLPYLPSAVTPSALDGLAVIPAEGRMQRADRTIAELHAQRQSLAGSRLTVRARVVAIAEAPTGRWLRLRDGSGRGEDRELVARSNERVVVGEEVLMQGKVVVDLDLGAGIRYPVVLDEARQVAEPKAAPTPRPAPPPPPTPGPSAGPEGE